MLFEKILKNIIYIYINEIYYQSKIFKKKHNYIFYEFFTIYF